MNFQKKLVKQVKRGGTGGSENATYCCGKSNGTANLVENMNRRCMLFCRKSNVKVHQNLFCR